MVRSWCALQQPGTEHNQPRRGCRQVNVALLKVIRAEAATTAVCAATGHMFRSLLRYDGADCTGRRLLGRQAGIGADFDTGNESTVYRSQVAAIVKMRAQFANFHLRNESFREISSDSK